MFASRHTRRGEAGVVDIVFTDRHGDGARAAAAAAATGESAFDLGERGAGRSERLEANLDVLAGTLCVQTIALMRQVHGRDVCVVDANMTPAPTCDGLVTRAADLALCVRVADCVPVVMADATRGVVGVAHAGRAGVVAGVVAATLDAMEGIGAQQVEAWIGPAICGGCYEVPAQLRDEVATGVPAAYAWTTWGTPSLDLVAAVSAQLGAAGCLVNDVSRCTRESADLYSYRRDGAGAGRGAGLVVLRPASGSTAGSAIDG